nr:Clp protease N-terminal domain-containing protein [Lactococcus fujiensis]
MKKLQVKIKLKKDKIKLSPRVEAIIEEAYNIATNNGTEVIGSEHLLYSILQNDQGSASQLLKLQKKFQ